MIVIELNLSFQIPVMLVPHHKINPTVAAVWCTRNHDRNVVVCGVVKHQTAELFEPEGRVFGRREMSRRAAVEGI